MMSKKRITLHVIAAVFLFLYFLLSRMPVYLMFNKLGAFEQYVEFGQPSGKLWHGSVSDVRIHAGGIPFSLGYTEWDIKPWKILLGKLALHIHAEKPQQSINADIELSVTRSITLSDAEITYDAGLIAQFYPVPGSLEGQFEINLKKLNLSANGINALDGNVILKNSRYTLNEPVDLGTFAAKLSFEKGAVKADLSDVDAVIEVSGVALIKPDTREYDINLNLLPSDEANPVIAQSLGSFFSSAANGSFQITKAGQF